MPRRLRLPLPLRDTAEPRRPSGRDGPGRRGGGHAHGLPSRRPRRSGRRRRLQEERETVMARLKSEIEVTCPCCNSTLVVDLNLGRVVGHKEVESADKPELDHAHRIVAEQAARREAAFQESVNAEKTRGDALSKRF